MAKKEPKKLKNISMNWVMEGQDKLVIKCFFKNDLQMMDLVPLYTSQQAFVSFYEVVYLPVSRFVSGGLIEANVLTPSLPILENKSLSGFNQKFMNKKLAEFKTKPPFQFVKSYSFEVRFFYGNITELFCGVFVDQLVLSHRGEIKAFNMNLLITNKENLSYLKESLNITDSDKIKFNPQLIEFEPEAGSGDEARAKESDSVLVNPVSGSSIAYSQIHRALYSGFNNYAELALNVNKNIKQEKYFSEAKGLRSVFQKLIKKRTLCKNGWLYRTEEEDGSTKYIYQGFDNSFRVFHQLDDCHRVVFLRDIGALFCQAETMLQLFDFQNSIPKRLRFFYSFAGARQNFLNKMALYQGTTGNLPYIVFHSRKTTESLRVALLLMRTNSYFELSIKTEFEVRFDGHKLQKFFVCNHKLILVFWRKMEVYYLDTILSRPVLLKRNYFSEMDMTPIFEKPVHLISSLQVPGKSNIFSSNISIVFIAKKQRRRQAPLMCVSHPLRQLKADRVCDARFEDEFRSAYESGADEFGARPEFGVLVYNVDKPMISSFESFIPLKSLFKENNKSNIQLSKEELAKPFDLENMLFFKKVEVIDRENEHDTKHNFSGLVILMKLKDWGQVQTGQSKNNENLILDLTYLNKFSMKFIFPVEPTLKIDLVGQKIQNKTERILQFMAVPAQEASADSRVQRESAETSQQHVGKRVQIEKDLLSHYQRVGEQTPKDKRWNGDIHLFRHKQFYQMSHFFVNKLSFNNQIRMQWNQKSNFNYLLRIVQNYQNAREDSRIEDMQEIKNLPGLSMTGVDRVSNDEEIRRMVKNEPNILEKITPEQPSQQESLQTLLHNAITPFWGIRRTEDPGENAKEQSPSVASRDNVADEDNDEVSMLTVQDYKKLKRFKILRELLPNQLETLFENKKQILLKIDMRQLVAGNILGTRLVMEFFPDNYHPLVTLTPIFQIVERLPFDDSTSKVLTKQMLRKGVGFFPSQNSNDMVLVTKYSVSLFNSNRMVESFPRSFLFYGSLDEILSTNLSNCLLKSIGGLNLLLQICFDHSLSSMDRRHSCEEVQSQSGQERTKKIYVFKFGQTRIAKGSLQKLIDLLYSIDFDDFEEKNNTLLFFKRDKHSGLNIIGDVHVYKLIVSHRELGLLIFANELTLIRNFFLKVKVFTDMVAHGDRFELMVPYKNIERTIRMQVRYFSPDDDPPCVGLTFKIQNLRIISHINRDFNGSQVLLHTSKHKHREVQILFVLSDMTVYVFSFKFSDMNERFEEKDLSACVEVSYYLSSTHGIESSQLKSAEVFHSSNLFLAIQHRQDVSFSLIDFGSRSHSIRLSILNSNPHRFLSKVYPKFQRVFERKLLIGVISTSAFLDKSFPIDRIDLKILFSDEILRVYLGFEYILQVVKIPFRSNLLFLELSNHYESCVLPLDIAHYKSHAWNTQVQGNHVNLLILFVFSSVLGFALVNFQQLEEYVKMKQKKPRSNSNPRRL